MDPQLLSKRTIQALRAAGDPARREATLGYYPSALENMGVAAAGIRAVGRELRAALKGAEPEPVLAVARSLVASKTLEGRQVAYELVEWHKSTGERLTLAEVEALGEGIDNWVSTDTFGVCVSGQAWRRGRIEDADVHRWARSSDRWWRRAALVSTVALNTPSRGGAGDAPRTLAVCSLLVDDRDDMVVKAISWALRKLAERDATAVKRFVAAHGERLAPRAAREVANKLGTGLKNPRSGALARPLPAAAGRNPRSGALARPLPVAARSRALFPKNEGEGEGRGKGAKKSQRKM